MKIAIIIIRSLLGLAFVVFGLNGFLHFIKPQPGQGPQGQALEFVTAMMQSGYFYPVAALQMLGGLILLSGRFVAAGLSILGPIVVNIVLFHFFLDRSGLGMAAVFAALTVFLIWGYRDRFAPIFKP